MNISAMIPLHMAGVKLQNIQLSHARFSGAGIFSSQNVVFKKVIACVKCILNKMF